MSDSPFIRSQEDKRQALREAIRRRRDEKEMRLERIKEERRLNGTWMPLSEAIDGESSRRTDNGK